jgi:plasmid stability protein
VKTTIELPDDLVRAVKLRAVREDRKLKDMVAELLRRGLAADTDLAAARGRRVPLPLIRGGHPAAPGEELTPERVANILLQDDVRSV